VRQYYHSSRTELGFFFKKPRAEQGRPRASANFRNSGRTNSNSQTSDIFLTRRLEDELRSSDLRALSPILIVGSIHDTLQHGIVN
jgi:hypothetical protein